MHYTMRQPCDDCPFLREGGIRLGRERIQEIAGAVLSNPGATFQCHKTTVFDEDDHELEEATVIPTTRDQHCAGALIFSEKHGRSTQMMRIAERLGMYDAAALMSNQAAVERVFNSLAEMLETAI